MCTYYFSLSFLWCRKSNLMLYPCYLQHTALCNANRGDDTHPEVSRNVFTFEICPLAIYYLLAHPRKSSMSLHHLQNRLTKLAREIHSFSIFDTFSFPLSSSVSPQETPWPAHILPCPLSLDCAVLLLTFMPLYKLFCSKWKTHFSVLMISK